MRNCSSKPESTYTRQSKFAIVHRPGPCLCLNAQTTLFKIEFRVLMFKVQTLGNKSVLKRECNLDDSRHTTGGFGVANVGLHRTDHARLISWTICSKHCSQRLGLNLVTHRRSCSMGFHVKQITGTNTRIPERGSQQNFLCLR